MPNINQFLSDLSKHSNAVKQTCLPLRHLGVTCFYYVSIKKNGDHILLTDCPHIDEYYYQEKIYLKDPYVRHPDNFQPGFFFFENNQEFDESLIHTVERFRISPLVGLCKKQEDGGVEFFGFWGESQRTSAFENIYLNYTTLLKTFASYFKEECSTIIQKNTVPCLSLRELIGPDLFDAKITSQANEKEKLLRKVLIEMGFATDVAMAEKLSSRERECLTFLVQGKSSKEIASLLNLSPRTIEHYFEHIKNKLNFQYKNELFSFADRLIKFGLI